MPTLAITLSPPQKDWLDQRAEAEGLDPAAYLASLIDRDRERVQKIAAMQAKIDAAFAGGTSKRTAEEIRQDARARLGL